MDSITRYYLNRTAKEHPRSAIHVISEMLSPRILRPDEHHAIGGLHPIDWDGSVIEIMWPGVSCEMPYITEKRLAAKTKKS